MQARLYFVVIIILTFLVSSVSLAGESTNTSEVEASVGTSLYHIKLAEHYEKESKEMYAKAEVEKKMLKEYEEHSEYYGRAGQEYHSHHEALLREFTSVAERNAQMAATHRGMAK